MCKEDTNMDNLLNKIEFDDFCFIKISPHSFMMGHNQKDTLAKENETPHMVELTKCYYLADTPVTVAQYRRYVEECGVDTSYLIEKWDGEDWVIGPYFDEINTDGDYPVVGVSYDDALSFIEWMQAKYNYNFRLPTEAEFEFAARSNCTCTDVCKYAEYAREHHLDRKEEEFPRKKSFSVEKMVTNSFGLKGMHCSIWQWCKDWYFYYLTEEMIDPQGPEKMPEYAPWKGEKWKPGKVIRGGSFSYPYYHSRCSDRHYSLVSDRNYNVGFRLAIEGE